MDFEFFDKETQNLNQTWLERVDFDFLSKNSKEFSDQLNILFLNVCFIFFFSNILFNLNISCFLKI